jgi:hypothetical protein
VFAGASARFVNSRGLVCRLLALRVDPALGTSDADDLHTGDARPQLGVYRRTGDELLWAVDAADEGRRPTSFEPTAGAWLWTLRRVKK